MFRLTKFNLNNEDEIFNEDKVSKENQTEGKIEGINQEDGEYKILNEKRTLEGLKDNFTKNGLKVGDDQVLVYRMPYAYDGLLFEVNGQSIEIYKYNLEKPYPDSKPFIEQAEAGLVYINDKKIIVNHNDGIITMNHDNHKDKNKIMQIFNNY